MADGYEIRPIDLSPEGIKKVTDLLREVFPKAEHFTEEVISWQYLENPDGKAVGMNAWNGDVLAGHYVTIPLKAMVFGKEEMGLLSLNTATHEDHRGKGLFTELAESTYSAAAEQGYTFVVGVANENSTHGFTKKLGFQLVSQLKAVVGTGRIAFSKEPVDLCFQPVRNKAKLQWRLGHPLHRYTTCEQRTGSLCMTDKKMRGATFMLAVSDQNKAYELAETSVPPVKAFIGLDPMIEWKNSMFFNVPNRLRPAPLNLIYRDLSNAKRQLDADKVEFQAIDFDTL